MNVGGKSWIAMLGLKIFQSWRPRPRLSQFSLRTMLLTMVALSLVCHWCRVQNSHNLLRHAAMIELNQAGATVHSDLDPQQLFRNGHMPRLASAWTWDNWRPLFSPRFQVQAIDLAGQSDDATQWRALRLFPEVRELALRQSRATHEQLAVLGEMCGVQRLILDGTRLDHESLAQVAQLAELRALSLVDTPVDDAGVAQLVALQKLAVLHLDGTAVTDRCVEFLKRMPSLTEVRLYRTRVTPDAVGELDRALPHAERCNPAVLAAPLRPLVMLSSSVAPNTQP
jgi:hypothetical protein